MEWETIFTQKRQSNAEATTRLRHHLDDHSTQRLQHVGLPLQRMQIAARVGERADLSRTKQSQQHSNSNSTCSKCGQPQLLLLPEPQYAAVIDLTHWRSCR